MDSPKKIGFDDELNEKEVQYDSIEEKDLILELIRQRLREIYPEGIMLILYYWGSRYPLEWNNNSRFWKNGDRFSDW